MPIFQLDNRISFPHPDLAEEDGLLAMGGDLSPERLLHAYSLGIFPWFSAGDPLLWWFTSPRLVIFPPEFTVPKRLARYIRTTDTYTSRDRAFTEVVKICAQSREERGEATWIVPEMQEAYNKLHRMGFAHSVECWRDGSLVGGLYGIALDRVFFGESMFSKISCGSQFAFVHLIDFLRKHGFKLIDCQMTTAHLLRFGAREISGKLFQKYLADNIINIAPQPFWKQ